MTATVQEHHIPWSEILLQAPLQAGKIQLIAGGIEVRVGAHLDPRRFKDLRVVCPGWVTEPDASPGVVPMDEVAGQPQGAGPTRGLEGNGLMSRNRFIRVVRAEEERSHRRSVLRRAGYVQIGFRSFIPEELGLDLFHSLQYRRFALCVAVLADAEVDLSGIGVLAERCTQSQDWVSRRHLQ